MLGTFRHRPADAESAQQYKRAYCATCVALRERSWLAPLALSREATLLTLIGGALNPSALTPREARCTAMPLKYRSLFTLDERARDVSAAFSIIAAYAQLEDHRKDGERLLLRAILTPSVRPHVAWALQTLGVDEAWADALSDPVDHDSSDLEGYLTAHHPTVARLWTHALLALTPDEVKTTLFAKLSRLGELLSDMMLLEDAIVDLEDDLSRGLPNPLSNSGVHAGGATLDARRVEAKSLLGAFADELSARPELSEDLTRGQRAALRAAQACIKAPSSTLSSPLSYPTSTTLTLQQTLKQLAFEDARARVTED